MLISEELFKLEKSIQAKHYKSYMTIYNFYLENNI